MKIGDLEGIKISGRNINNIRYVGDIVFLANTEGNFSVCQLYKQSRKALIKINKKKNGSHVDVKERERDRDRI